MGTNFFHIVTLCEHCGNTERLHVGKSSAGWCFALRVYPEQGINDLPDWDTRAETGRFENEYGDAISWPELRTVITERSSPRPLPAHHVNNWVMPGPNNLGRCRLEEGHCVSHGEGPWDCFVGEFS